MHLKTDPGNRRWLQAVSPSNMVLPTMNSWQDRYFPGQTPQDQKPTNASFSQGITRLIITGNIYIFF